MIKFSGAGYFYPGCDKPALDNLDLEIEDGAFILVIGDSGSGKSTFLRCMNGLIPHFYGGRFLGDVTTGGLNTKDHPVAVLSRKTGFVFQDAASQAVNRRVEDEIAFGLENLGSPAEQISGRIEETADSIGISNLLERDVATLSGGERQKVAIACALAMQPETLVLDEPTSELDPASAGEVLNLLEKLNRDFGLTIVISEHRLERVIRYADSAIYIERGRAVKGPVREILKMADLAPPLVKLALRSGWEPLPLTVQEAREFVRDAETPTVNEPPVKRPEKTLIEAAGLTFSYGGNEVLRGVDFTVKAGEIVALIGRNGTGKTTLLKNLCGLLKPESGDVEHTSSDGEKKTHLIGYVPQRPSSMLFAETVKEEIEASLKLHKRPLDAAVNILPGIGLAGKDACYPRDLSLGEQQRVAIGSVLVLEPELLIMDEPTHGLSYKDKATLVGLLKRLAAEGKAVILATHDVELAAQCADRVIHLVNGRLSIDAPARDALCGSEVFSTQMNKIFGGRVLTLEDIDAVGD